MLTAENLGTGLVMGFGATHAREGIAADGDIINFNKPLTPHQPDEFFAWIGQRIFEAGHAGHGWAVLGLPGPVANKGGKTMIGPFANIGGMKHKAYDLRKHLAEADSAVGDMLEEGFNIVVVNDGSLAAQAVALCMNEEKHDRVAALINGTGLGTGMVERDSNNPEIFRVIDLPLEKGHILRYIEGKPVIATDTPENRISGTAIEKQFGDPRDLSKSHGVWRRVGAEMGVIAFNLGVEFGAELVVPTGGVGANASDKYGAAMLRVVEPITRERHPDGNTTQQNAAPQIRFVPVGQGEGAFKEDEFELAGGEGVMRAHLLPLAA